MYTCCLLLLNLTALLRKHAEIFLIVALRFSLCPLCFYLTHLFSSVYRAVFHWQIILLPASYSTCVASGRSWIFESVIDFLNLMPQSVFVDLKTADILITLEICCCYLACKSASCFSDSASSAAFLEFDRVRISTMFDLSFPCLNLEGFFWSTFTCKDSPLKASLALWTQRATDHRHLYLQHHTPGSDLSTGV